MCYWGSVAGFPWLIFIIAGMFFLGMLFLLCRPRYRWFANCRCHEPSDLAGEVARVRKELEELKKR